MLNTVVDSLHAWAPSTGQEIPGLLASLVFIHMLLPHLWLGKVHAGPAGGPLPPLLWLAAPGAAAHIARLLALLSTCIAPAALTSFCLLLALLWWLRCRSSCGSSDARLLGSRFGRASSIPGLLYLLLLLWRSAQLVLRQVLLLSC